MPLLFMGKFLPVILVFVLVFFRIVLTERLYSATATYTFSGITNPSSTSVAKTTDSSALVYRSTLGALGTELTTNQYSSITVSDNVRLTYDTPLVGNYPVSDFIFKVNEAVADITQVDYKWEGYGCRGNGCGGSFEAYSYWWDVTNSTWVFVGSTTASTDATIQRTTTTLISNIFDANKNIVVRAQGPRRSVSGFLDQIRTDYVEMVITFKAAGGGNERKTDKNYGITFGQKPKIHRKRYVPGKEPELIGMRGG